MILQAPISWKPSGKAATVESSYLWLINSDVLKNYFKQATKRSLWMEKFYVNNTLPFEKILSLLT